MWIPRHLYNGRVPLQILVSPGVLESVPGGYGRRAVLVNVLFWNSNYFTARPVQVSGLGTQVPPAALLLMVYSVFKMVLSFCRCFHLILYNLHTVTMWSMLLGSSGQCTAGEGEREEAEAAPPTGVHCGDSAVHVCKLSGWQLAEGARRGNEVCTKC